MDKSKVILRVSPTAKLIRDEYFLDAVIATAKQHELPVELAGSLLGHAYYKIRSAGIVVYTAEPYAAYFRVRGRKMFHKLVRNEIPKKIGMGGAKTIQARLSDDDAIFALLGKLIEEGQELGRAKTDSERAEELAHIYEILRALAA
jgi:predicted house-cleaning noncanonical NTP pyrophosphatase (MazG superfamily)